MAGPRADSGQLRIFRLFRFCRLAMDAGSDLIPVHSSRRLCRLTKPWCSPDASVLARGSGSSVNSGQVRMESSRNRLRLAMDAGSARSGLRASVSVSRPANCCMASGSSINPAASIVMCCRCERRNAWSGNCGSGTERSSSATRPGWVASSSRSAVAFSARPLRVSICGLLLLAWRHALCQRLRSAL